MPAKKTKKTTKKIEVKKPSLVVGEGCLSMVLTADEILSTIQIFGFSKDVFAQMAFDCRNQGDERGAMIWGARAELTVMLFKKFRTVAGIGEPAPGEIH